MEDFDWGGTLGNLLDSGVSVFKATQTKPATTVPKPVAAKPADTSWIKWAIGGGAALLVVVVIAFALRRGK